MEQRARAHLERLLSGGSFEPVQDFSDISDPLEWPGYEDAIGRSRASGADESVTAGPAQIGELDVELALFDFSFFGGSMGRVAGERLAGALERAAAARRPFVLRTASGGARMQEGMVALAQMPKVVAARLELAEAHTPFIAVLGHPTTGGVLASLGALADVTIAEHGATIGFAGPRIVERFTGRPVAGSHTAATALTAGLVDAVVPAEEMGRTLSHVLTVLRPDDPEPAGRAEGAAEGSPPEGDPGQHLQDAVEEGGSTERPRAPDVLRDCLEDHAVLQGDRAGREDPAVVVALGRLAGRRVIAMALDRAFSPGPSAYRKARRCVGIAARLQLPVLTLVDTPGANPSEASENGGIAWEIAELFSALLSAPVPVVSVVTGQGGSGGALAFATADVLLAYAGSTFSVIAPEMAAQILWRDPAKAAEAAALLKPTAGDLHRLGIADRILGEPVEAASLTAAVTYHLDLLRDVGAAELVAARRQRWRSRG